MRCKNKILAARPIALTAVLAIFLAASSAAIGAAGGETRLAEAEKFSAAKDFEKARAIYAEAFRANEARSGGFYYNYGTLSLRANQPGEASVLLRQALRLSPTDGEARANAHAARAKLNPLVRDTRPAAWLSWWPEPLRLLPLSLWWILGLACLAPFLLATIRGRDPAWRWPAGAAAGVLLLAGLLASYDQRYYAGGLLQVTKVLSGPARSFPEIGNLDAGTLVTVEEIRGPWLKIRYVTPRPLEVVGWVDAAAVLQFPPR